MRAETVQRVRQVAEELGYRPNPLARGLKTNRSYTIGVLVPDIQNPLFPPIIRGLDDRLGESGYTPLIANTDNDPVRERVDLEAMRARQVDGFVAAQMIVQAVREGGDDVESMIDALEGWSFESVKGEVTVRAEDHALVQPMYQVSLVEGDAGWEPELVETIDAETVAPPVAE